MNILLIDKRVQYYETIVAAIDPALAIGVVFDYYEDTFETVKTRMRELEVASPSLGNSISVGLIQHNYREPTFTMLASADVAPVAQVESKDPNLADWVQFRDFITWCKTELNAAHFDMMACALYSDPEWKYVIDTLSTQTGITVRASTDDTGAAELGGDWFLESHTGVNLKTVYFTEAIEQYRGILYFVTWTNTSTQQLKSISPGRAILWGDAYAQTTSNYNSNTNLQSDIISVCATSGNYGHWSALKTDGTVVSSSNNGNLVTIGETTYNGTLVTIGQETLTNVVAVYSNKYGFAGLTSTGRVVTWGSGTIWENNRNNSIIQYYDSDYYSVTSSLQTGCIDVFSQPDNFIVLKNDGTTVGWGIDTNITGVNITGTSGQFSCNYNSRLNIGYLITISGTISGTGTISGYTNPTTYKISSSSGGGFTLTTLNNVAITTTSGTTDGLTFSNNPFNDHNNIVTIVSNNFSYAALKSDGSVLTWGRYDAGGDTSITIASGPYAGNTVKSQLNSNVVSLYSGTYGFAALKSNGDFIYWRSTNSSGSATNVVYAKADRAGIYALKVNGGIIGYENYTGFLALPSGSSEINQAVGSNVVKIFETERTVTVLKRDASLFIFGEDNGPVGIRYKDQNNNWVSVDTANTVDVYYFGYLMGSYLNVNTIADIYSGGECMAALKNDGSLITWGHEGGNSQSVSSFLSSNIVAAYPASTDKFFSAMLALNNSGEVKAWGRSDRGGVIHSSIASQVTSGIVAVYSSLHGYYVIKSTASTFDLSASYYRSIDRYKILRSKNNRRRANLNTLNNNVFTLSGSGELSKINLNIPTSKTLKIIVPDYSSSISFTSAATLPDTSGSFIIACEECEPVLISGTRYINYGGYVYNDTSSNFTKLTTAYINNRPYHLYGGNGGSDDSFLSGIVFSEVIVETPSLASSTFTVASSKTLGDAPFAITTRPTSNSDGLITYSSSNTNVATIDVSGDFITIIGTGDVSFTATQAAAFQYFSATKTSNTLSVREISTLLDSSFSVASSKTFGDASFSFDVLPTSNSDGLITYSSSNTNVATVDASGTTITLVGAGDVSFNASQAQTNQYFSATKTSNTLSVARGTSTLSGSSFSVAASKTFGDASFSFDVLPTSNSDGVITYSSSNTNVATVDASGTTITLVGAGDVSFNASQAQTNQYNTSTKTSNTLTVARGTSTLLDSSFSVAASKTFGDASFSFDVLPTSNSDGVITYSSSNTNVATVDASGTTITLVGAGDVSFNASQAQTNQYNTSTKTSNTLTVARGTSTLLDSSFSVAASKTFGDASFSFDVLPTSNSDGLITYSSSNPNVATVDASGTTITLVGAGDVSFNAAQEQTNQYFSATKTSNTLSVVRGTSTLLDSSFSVAASKTFGDASFSFDVLPTSNSDGVITYSSSNPNVATVDASGTTITLVGAGDVSFNAAQEQTNQYNAATKTSNTLSVERATSTLLDSSFSVAASKTFGDASFSFDVLPTSNSDGLITYSSSNLNVATVDASGTTITLVGAGDVSFNAAQEQTNQYNTSTKTSNTLSVVRGTSTLLDSSFSVASSKTFGDASFSFDVLPTSNSDGLITYSSSNPNVATVDASGTTITLVGAGDVSFNAAQEQTNQYFSATKTSNTLSVARGTSTLSESTFQVASSKTFGDASFSFDVLPTSNSDGVITYSSSNPNVATVDASGTTITLVGAGDVSFNAAQEQTNQYNTSTKTSNTLSVARGTSTLSESTFQVASSKTIGDDPFSFDVLPTSNNTSVPVVYSSSNTNVATVDASGTTITIVGVGEVSFISAQEQTNQYNPATKTSNTLTVREISTLVDSSFSVAASKTFGDDPFSFDVLPTSNNISVPIVYSSSNPNVATVDPSGTTITLVGAGDVSFNASQAQTTQYNAATKTSNTLSVARATSTFLDSSFSVASSKTFGDASFSFDILPTSNSDGLIIYSSSNTDVATVDASGTTITLVGAGDVSFNATQAQTNQYFSATKTSNTLTVARGTSTLSGSSFSVASSKTFSDAPFSFDVLPTSNNISVPIVYSSNNPNVATVDASGTTITIVDVGDVSFNASQEQTNQYNAAIKSSNTLIVGRGTSTLAGSSFSVASSKTFGDASFVITVQPTSNNTSVPIVYSSSNTNVATIDASGNFITLISAGDVSFNASQAQTTQYNAATKTSNILTVSRGETTLAFVSPPTTKNVIDDTFTVVANSESSGAVTYTSSNPAVATVGLTTGLVTLLDIGSVTITAAQAVTSQYNAPTNATCTFTIEAAATLSGQTVTISLANKNLTGTSFVNTTLNNISLAGANLNNVNFSGASIIGTNFTNANISGATNLPMFSTAQKLQLMRNANNSSVNAIQILTTLSGAEINAIIATPISDISAATFVVKAPSYNVNNVKVVTVTPQDLSNKQSVYIPMNTNETVEVNGIAYTFDGTNILNSSGSVIQFINILETPFRVYAGSIVALNVADELNNIKIGGDGLYNILTGLFATKP